MCGCVLRHCSGGLEGEGWAILLHCLEWRTLYCRPDRQPDWLAVRQLERREVCSTEWGTAVVRDSCHKDIKSLVPAEHSNVQPMRAQYLEDLDQWEMRVLHSGKGLVTVHLTPGGYQGVTRGHSLQEADMPGLTVRSSGCCYSDLIIVQMSSLFFILNLECVWR